MECEALGDPLSLVLCAIETMGASGGRAKRATDGIYQTGEMSLEDDPPPGGFKTE